MHTFFWVLFFRLWPHSVSKRIAKNNQMPQLLCILLDGFACRCIRLLFNSLNFFCYSLKTSLFLFQNDPRTSKQKEIQPHSHTLGEPNILAVQPKQSKSTMKHIPFVCILYACEPANTRKKRRTRTKPNI